MIAKKTKKKQQHVIKLRIESVMYAFNSHLSYKYNTSPNPYDNK